MPGQGKHTLIINQVTASTTIVAADLYSDDNFSAVLESHAHITVAKLSQTPEDANVAGIQNSATRYGTIQSNKRKLVDGNNLARRLVIPSDKAHATVKKTTKRDVRSTLHPTIFHRFLITTGCCGTDVCRTQFLVTLFNLVAYLQLE